MGGPGLKHGVLRVWRQFSRINGEMVEAPLKTKKYLPYPASGREYGKRSGSTEGRKRGAAPACSPPRRAGPSPRTAWGRCSTVRCGGRGCLGFSFTICGTLLPLCPPEWGGAEDGIRDTETLLGGVHPGHLRPCDHGLPTGRRPNYGQYPPRQAPDLTAPQSRMGYGLGLGIFSLRIRQRRTYNATCANDAHKARFEF